MTVLPLYREAREAPPTLRAAGIQWAGHPGLWFEKFFDRWESERFDKIAERGKQEWVSTVVGSNQRAGEPVLITEHHRRRAALIAELGGFVIPPLTLQSPFVTGLGYEHPIENGFLWHPLLGTPYLPGSSVKGGLRAWLTTWNDEPDVARLLGSERNVGAWTVFDALPIEPVRLGCEIMTPHDAGWRIREGTELTPSDWVSPNPIPFLVVQPGARFSFAFAPRRGGDARPEDAERIAVWLHEALDFIGAGSKTATGFGRFA